MSLAILKIEIQTDPLARGYSGMTNAQIITSLKTLNRTRSRGVISSYEVVNALVPAEWAALTAQEKQRLELIIGAGNIDVANTNVRNAFTTAFGVGTATRTALVALQNETISRLTELGIGEPHEGDIQWARTN